MTLRLKSVSYQQDGKPETRLNFGDAFSIVISAPVSVRVEGEIPPELDADLEAFCKEVKEEASQVIDLALFHFAAESLKASGMIGQADNSTFSEKVRAALRAWLDLM